MVDLTDFNITELFQFNFLMFPNPKILMYVDTSISDCVECFAVMLSASCTEKTSV